MDVRMSLNSRLRVRSRTNNGVPCLGYLHLPSTSATCNSILSGPSFRQSCPSLLMIHYLVHSSPTGRRKSYSRPWSVRGHKATHSESSSLVKQDFVGNNEIHLSPGLLPTLFGSIPDLPRSPFSLDTTFQSIDAGFEPPPTPPPEFVPGTIVFAVST